MAVGYSTVYSDLYDLAASDSLGADLRNLVGSIFPAEQLSSLSGKVLPYLVWKEQTIPGGTGDILDVNVSWWIYIDLARSTKAFYPIMEALDALYGGANRYAVDGGKVEIAHRGAPFVDEGLKLRGREVRLTWRALG